MAATSLNPLSYKPAEVAKALVALVTAAIGILGLVASDLATGGFATAGAWVAGIAAVLTPVLVFLQRAEAVVDVVDPPSPSASA